MGFYKISEKKTEKPRPWQNTQQRREGESHSSTQWVRSSMATNRNAMIQELILIFLKSPVKIPMMM